MLQCTKNKTQNLKHNNGKHNKLVVKKRQKTQQQMSIKSTFCNTPAPLRRTIKTVQDRASSVTICKVKAPKHFFQKKTLCNVAMYTKSKTRNLKHNNGKHNKLVGENRQKTQRQMNIKSTFCNTPAPLRQKAKTADGTKKMPDGLSGKTLGLQVVI